MQMLILCLDAGRRVGDHDVAGHVARNILQGMFRLFPIVRLNLRFWRVTLAGRCGTSTSGRRKPADDSSAHELCQEAYG
jgi:hypothetical protein